MIVLLMLMNVLFKILVHSFQWDFGWALFHWLSHLSDHRGLKLGILLW